MLLSRAGVELLALGDVLVRADEAAVGHRQAEHGNGPSIGQLNDLRHLLPEALYAVVDEVSSVDVVVDAIGGAGLQDLPQRRATLNLLARQSIDFGIAAVGDDDTLVDVEQADTLWYVVDRHVEARVLRLQVLLMLQDQLALALQLLRCRTLLAQIAEGIYLEVLQPGADRLACHLDRNRRARGCLEPCPPM